MRVLVIWDWDNTLMNTKPAVMAGLQDVAAFFGQQPVTEEEVVNVMTHHRGAFWQNRFGDQMVSAIDYYVSKYQDYLELVCPFEKTTAVLKAVQEKHIPQVLVSNKNHESLIKEVARHKLSSYFAAILGTKDFLGKPDPLFIQPILQQFCPDEIILIGDGQSDMELARNIGATAILVHRSESDLPYDYNCVDLGEVLSVLQKIAFDNIKIFNHERK